jgi:aerobic C4-dicarboxylate transport protein
MSEARAITNLIGNGVATVVVSKSENEFNPDGYVETEDEERSSKIDSSVSA